MLSLALARPERPCSSLSDFAHPEAGRRKSVVERSLSAAPPAFSRAPAGALPSLPFHPRFRLTGLRVTKPTSPAGAQENADLTARVLRFSLALTGACPCVGSRPGFCPTAPAWGYYPTALRGLTRRQGADSIKRPRIWRARAAYRNPASVAPPRSALRLWFCARSPCWVRDENNGNYPGY